MGDSISKMWNLPDQCARRPPNMLNPSTEEIIGAWIKYTAMIPVESCTVQAIRNVTC